MTRTERARFSTAMLPAIFALAWPTMLEQLMQTTVQYIDTAMVSSLGTTATAAVGCTGTVTWLICGSIYALAVGFLTFIAQALGAGDKERAVHVTSQATLAVLVSGIFFTALALSLSRKIPVWMQADESVRDLASTYFFILYAPMLARAASIIYGTALRAAGDSRTPMRVGLWVNLINVVGNYLLIYPTRTVNLFGLSFTMPGAGWGVVGAGIASAASFVFGGVRITVALWRHPLVSPRGRSIRPDPEVLGPCLRVALPNFLQRFGTSLGYVVFASMINSLGEVATAAHTIANTVESAFYIPGYGMQAAAATLSGNALGARDQKRMRDLPATVIPIETALMMISGALLFIFAPFMMGLFSRSSEVTRLGATVLRMVALSEPFFGVSIIIEGMLQGVGDTLTPFVYGLSSMWIVRIGGAAILVGMMGLGLVAAWGCMIAHNFTLFLLLGIHFLRHGLVPRGKLKR